MASIRRKIRNTFQSAALKTALLTELSTSSPDAELVVKMVERVQPTRTAVIQPTPQPVQAVQPVLQPVPVPVQQVPVQPPPAQRVQPAQPVAAQIVGDGSSEDTAVEVQDSEDELVEEMRLSPRRAQRLRRQLQIWRERASSSSE